MNVHVVGHRGQLGTEVISALGANHQVRGTDLPDIDITNPASIETALQDGPDVIVNCAAYTNVDGCESHEDLARQVNTEGPRNLASYAARRDALLVHISTDYVFDGKRPVPEAYREDDVTEPTSVYGHVKRDGERAILDVGCRCAILRTSWLYGIHGANFLKTILRVALVKPSGTVKVVDDQYGCPTWAYRLAQQIGAVVEQGATGIMHASGRGSCTWYGLASTFLAEMGVDRDILPCTTQEYPTPATRPQNSILENGRLRELGIDLMTDWRLDVRDFSQRYHDQLLEEATRP